MKIKPYIEKLESSKMYQQFENEHKDAFLVAGFFVLDFETGQKLHQIDYYVPSENKVAAFTLDKKVEMQLLALLDKKMPEQLDIRTNIDLEALKGVIEDEMKNRGITEDVKKMIVVLQQIKGKRIWNVSCILSGMDLLRSHVDDESKTILKMEKTSMMDFIKKMPMLGPTPKRQMTNKEMEEKINELDKIKEALKGEEVKVKKNSQNKS